MTFVVEKDETADPIEVGLLGSDAVASNAQMPADLIEKFLRPLGDDAGERRRFFGDAKAVLRLRDDGQSGAGRLPPVLDSWESG